MKIFTIGNETGNVTVHASVREAEAVPDSECFDSEAALARLKGAAALENARLHEETIHQEKLRRIEAPYYGADGRLSVERLRAAPVVRHPLRPDVLAGWSDPAGPLVTLGRPPPDRVDARQATP